MILAVSFPMMAPAGLLSRFLGPVLLGEITRIIGILPGAYAVENSIEGLTTAMSLHQQQEHT